MSNSLQDSMTWEEIAEHIKEKAYPDNPKKFKEWFMTKEYLGYIFDPITYGRAFHISEQLKKDYDHITVIAGKERNGKSEFSLNFCCLVSPSFSIKHIFFKNTRFVQTLKDKLPKGDSLLADEGGLIFFSRDSQSKANKDTVKMMTVMGSRNLHVVINIINYWLLDSYIRDHRVGTIFHVTDRGHFVGYTGEKAFSIISNHGYKNFKRFEGIKVPGGSMWHGYWNHSFPTQNDITKVAYETEKNKAFDDYLNEVLKNTAVEDDLSAEVTQDFYSPTEVATILGMTKDTIKRNIGENIIPAFKLAGSYFIPKQFIEDLKTKVKKEEPKK